MTEKASAAPEMAAGETGRVGRTESPEWSAQLRVDLDPDLVSGFSTET